MEKVTFSNFQHLYPDEERKGEERGRSLNQKEREREKNEVRKREQKGKQPEERREAQCVSDGTPWPPQPCQQLNGCHFSTWDFLLVQTQ